jgi:hypothetical protein
MRGRHFRVLRGGSWNNNPNNCRSANRNRNNPDNTNNNLGFRLVVGVVACTLHGESLRVGIRRENVVVHVMVFHAVTDYNGIRRVQTCSGDGGDSIRI